MGKQTISGPTQTAVEGASHEWAPRPFVAGATRIAIIVFPYIVGFTLAILMGRLFPAERLGVNRWLWFVGVAIASTLVMIPADRLVRRLVPITGLLTVALGFPDAAPSRFKVAMRSTTTAQVRRRIEAALAAEQVQGDLDRNQYLLDLVAVLTQHDRLTRGHSERVRAYSTLVGEEIRLSKSEQQKLYWAALLHDIGKLDVPSDILNKTGRPDEHEWKILQGHPAAAERYLAPLRGWLGEWSKAADEHHLRWDGKGYPSDIGGTDISLPGRIVAIADAYDVMTSARSYKKPMSAADARVELSRCAGGQFDPHLVRAFLNIGLTRVRLAGGVLASLPALVSAIVTPLATNGGRVLLATTAVTGGVAAAPLIDIAPPEPVEVVVDFDQIAVGAVPTPTPTLFPTATPIPTLPPVLVASSAVETVATPEPVLLEEPPTPNPLFEFDLEVPGTGTSRVPLGTAPSITVATPTPTATATPTATPTPVSTPAATPTVFELIVAATPLPVQPTAVPTSTALPTATIAPPATATSTPVPATCPDLIGCPVVVDDAYSVVQGELVNLHILDNDLPPSGGALDESTLKILVFPEHDVNGQFKAHNGHMHFKAKKNYEGPDSFTYQICTVDGLCDTATVAISIVSSAPVAVLTPTPTSTPLPTPTATVLPTPTPTVLPTPTPTVTVLPTPTPVPGQAAAGLLISEYATDSAFPGGDFVEIYNGTGGPVDITGWELHIYDDGSAPIEIAAFALANGWGDTIPNGRRILFAQAGSTLSSAAEGTFAIPLAPATGLGIWDGTQYIDAVGNRARNHNGIVLAAGISEGQALPPLIQANGFEQSYERRNGGAAGNCVDTDDNTADFVKNVAAGSASPQGLSADFVSCGELTAPTGPPADHLVISEFRTDGDGGGDDEFLELFNPTGDAIQLGDYSVLDVDPATNAIQLEINLPTGFLDPGDHFVIGGASYDGDTDAVYSGGGIQNKGAIKIVVTASLEVTATLEVIDEVELGAGLGSPVLPELNGRLDQVYIRINGGCTDTDSAADFEYVAQSSPTVQGVEVVPCTVG